MLSDCWLVSTQLRKNGLIQHIKTELQVQNPLSEERHLNDKPIFV